MKTQEELNALKEEYETLNKKLCDLSEDEFAQVSGGVHPRCICTVGKPPASSKEYPSH